MAYSANLTKTYIHFFLKNCICFRPCWVSVADRGRSLVEMPGPVMAVAFLVAEHGLGGARASAAVACGLESAGSVAAVRRLSCPTVYGISQTRDQTSVPCIGRRILNHWAVREVHVYMKVKWKWLSRVRLLVTPWTDYTVHGILQARILERVAFPFSPGSSQPRDQTHVSQIAGFLTSWVPREAPTCIDFSI